jgi:hypothetical protein
VRSLAEYSFSEKKKEEEEQELLAHQLLSFTSLLGVVDEWREKMTRHRPYAKVGGGGHAGNITLS